jgi:catechol 2,3-dioxygenase-like lactoylglutathione lyase family enzyme
MADAAGLLPVASAVLPFPLGKVDQVALVVHDLDAVVREYWERLGIGPWTIVTFGPGTVRELYYRGRPASFRMRAAFAMTDNVQLEIIESLDGPNIYEEFLAAHGEGVHHLGIRVPDLRAAVAEMEARGYVVIQAGYGTGTNGEGGFAYFETDGLLGTLIEFLELPRQRIAAASCYPLEA